jgi:tetratricopeptide (TPR) repeat protein
MDTLEIQRGARVVVFELLDAEFSIGDGPADSLVVSGVGPAALRVSSTPRGRRVEGAGLVVNGKPVERRELRHGDRIEIGGVTIAYREADKPWPVEPEPIGAGLDLRIDPIPAKRTANSARSAAPSTGKARAVAAPTGGRAQPVPPVRASAPVAKGRGRAEREERTDADHGDRAGRRDRRRSSGSPWLLWNLILVVAVVGFVLMRSMISGKIERDARDLLTLAHSQYRSGDASAALATLGLALERDPDGETRSRIAALRKQIEDAAKLAADAPLVAAAERDHREIERFLEINLAVDPSRAAAREFLRLCDAWLTNHARIADRNADVDRWRSGVKEARRRFEALAAMDTPDTAADVLFVASRCLRFEVRDYRRAIVALESWLQSADADSDGANAVRTELQSLREKGPSWLAEHRAKIERMVDRGETQRAIMELKRLLDGPRVPAEWLGDAASRLSQLEASSR